MIFTSSKVKPNPNPNPNSTERGTRIIYKHIILIFTLLFTFSTQSQEKPTEPLLFSKLESKSLEYIGGFRLPVGKKGSSRLAYAQGIFALSPHDNTLFIVGHTHKQAVAELIIPSIALPGKESDWPIAKFKQPFSEVLSRAKHGNPQKINRITGMVVVNHQLVINGMEYYDGDTNVNNTTLILRDSDNIEASIVDGFFNLKGAAHAAGWISKVPREWRNALNSDFIFGNASTYAINSRLSIGPSAFGVYLWGLLDSKVSSGIISTDKFMDFSVSNPIVDDQYNKKGENNLWTEISSAFYGFIIPKTSTYFVIGNSGGHKGGIGYKATQDTGKICAGPCALVASDIYNYFWLFNVDDFLKVKSGVSNSYDIQPYQYGIFDQRHVRSQIIAADFQESTNRLFVLYGNEDRSQSKYEPAPLMRVYQLNLD